MKSVRPTALRLGAGLVLTAALASPALAITDEEIFRNFRFNFSNPGARALAMGGAFIAIANDATAAQANPARLAVLRRPEFFFEVRNRDTKESENDTGQFFIDPATNPAASLSLNSTVTPETQTIPSVVSFVWPFAMRRALTVGVSRQEILAVESSTTNDFSLIPVGSSPFQDPNDPEDVLNASVGAIDSTLVLWNLSAGYQITRDLFVGGSIVHGQLDMQSDIVSTFADPDAQTGLGNFDPRFETPQGRPIITTAIDDTDTDITWSFGLFWKPNDYLQFGTVYKKGVQMVVDEFVDERPVSGTRTIDTTFNVPDVAGFGIAYRPFARGSARAQNLLFAADVLRVENGDLVEGFTSQLNVLTLPQFIESIEFSADTTTELHLGAEYYLPIGRSATIAFRAGFFTDPDNSIHAESVGQDVGISGFRDAIVKGEAFPERDDETHVTGGIGFSIGDFEFAAAVDSSDIENQSLFSVIYRLKR